MTDKLDVSGSQNVSALPDVLEMLKNIACAPLADPNVSNSDRIAAARTLLTGASAYQDRKALENHIQELESRLLRLADAFPTDASAVSWEHEASHSPEPVEDLQALAEQVLRDTPEEE